MMEWTLAIIALSAVLWVLLAVWRFVRFRRGHRARIAEIDRLSEKLRHTNTPEEAQAVIDELVQLKESL